MKKIIRTIIAAGFGVALFASCEKELPHRVVTPIDTPAEISLSVEGVSETFGIMAPKTKTYNIQITAKSKADQLLTFTVAADPTRVDAYNKAHGTDYEMVPGDAYELSTQTFYLPRYNTNASSGTVTLKANGLPDDGKTRVLPISITEIKGDAETNMTAADSTVFITVYRVSLADIRFEKGKGTQAEPYLVEYANDMLAMINDLKEGEPTYIKLANDIDMSTVEEWMPVNITEPYKTIHFDGDGHTIKNLSSNASTMPSLFGVIKGSVKNVNFENCTIEAGASNAGAGIVAGKAIDAEIKNITGTGNTIKSMAAANGSGKHIGGIAGIVTNSKFEDINIGVDITDGNEDGVFTRMIGGLVGIVLPEMSDDDAVIKTFTDKDKKHSTFNNCHVKGKIAAYHYSGGFIGAISVENTEITNCSADVDMNFTAGGNYAGGFIGYANKGLKLTNCHASGDINSSGNYKGGLIGAIQGNAVIKSSSYTGNIVNTSGTHVGGFIGNAGIGTADYNDKTLVGNTVIEDCYTSGSLTVTEGGSNKGRMQGGLVGVIEKAHGISIIRCYSDMNMSVKGANGAVGGLVGIAVETSSNLDVSIEFTMEGSIAWNAIIDNEAPNISGGYSVGALCGAVAKQSTLSNNYRRSDMNLIEVKAQGSYSLEDHASAEALAPAGARCPYHGVAAPAGATCSSVAKTLGWPESVWDLSGDMPKLK